MKRYILLFTILILSSVVVYSTSTNAKNRARYNITEENVESIYCEYYMGNKQLLPVSEEDKKIIISDFSKMRERKTEAQIGTVSYRFVILMKDGNKFTFIQNCNNKIEVYSEQDKRQFYIYAPKTLKFLGRYIKEKNKLYENSINSR